MRRLPYSSLQYQHWNPGASAPLVLPVTVTCNTPDDVLHENIRVNSLRPNEWLFNRPAHNRVALICGGGPSLADDLAEIRERAAEDNVDVFALNGAAKFLHDRGLMPDYQVVLDPQAETANLVGPARMHLLASQVDPECFERAPNAMLWHLQVEGIDDLLPPNHRERDYTLLGAASSVGTTSLVVAFTLGYRAIHVYGCDSSHRGGSGHAFPQPMNDGEPLCSVMFGGKDYLTSLTMKLQAERFPVIARLLERDGCKVFVHGSGLLPDIWNAPVEALSEQEKYERLWSLPEYRIFAPGEESVAEFMKVAQPSEGADVLDLGSGTGRASALLRKAGLSPLMVDFAANCRDLDVGDIPFLQHDMTKPLPVRGAYGFCTDVMEHIPPEDLHGVLGNIFAAAPNVYFRIDTMPDLCGAMINQQLHLSVLHHDEWLAILERYGRIAYARLGDGYSVFYVCKEPT